MESGLVPYVLGRTTVLGCTFIVYGLVEFQDLPTLLGQRQGYTFSCSPAIATFGKGVLTHDFPSAHPATVLALSPPSLL